MLHSFTLGFTTGNRFPRLPVAWLCWCVCCASWLMAVQPAAAHPFHISLAEMEWNPQAKHFEVSLKVHGLDIENALSRMTKRRVRLEVVEEADKLLAEYLTTHLYLHHLSADAASAARDGSLAVDAQKGLAEATGQAAETQAYVLPREALERNEDWATRRSTLKVVGREQEKSWLWIYVELKPPSTLLKSHAGSGKVEQAAEIADNSDSESKTESALATWPSDLTLVNRVLLDMIEGQINTVTIRHGRQRDSLKMDVKHPAWPFAREWIR